MPATFRMHFSHGAALGWVCEFVADENAVFVVLIAGGSMRVTGNARNRARRDAALRDFVALVGAVSVRAWCSDQFAALDDWRL